jgi:hypothetical protein
LIGQKAEADFSMGATETMLLDYWWRRSMAGQLIDVAVEMTHQYYFHLLQNSILAWPLDAPQCLTTWFSSMSDHLMLLNVWPLDAPQCLTTW